MRTLMKWTRLMRLTSVAALALLCLIAAHAQSGGPYDLSWSTIDGGGATFSTGGLFKLGGTVGQPDAFGMPPHTGGAFTLTGGFWFVRLPGDTTFSGCVNDQDIALVLREFGNTGLNNADVNDDGIVNNADLFIVLSNFSLGC